MCDGEKSIIVGRPLGAPQQVYATCWLTTSRSAWEMSAFLSSAQVAAPGEGWRWAAACCEGCSGIQLKLAGGGELWEYGWGKRSRRRRLKKQGWWRFIPFSEQSFSLPLLVQTFLACSSIFPRQSCSLPHSDLRRLEGCWGAAPALPDLPAKVSARGLGFGHSCFY